jgi:hypothetical protein
MLNLAGSSYDFAPVLFAVLQECEHQRRALGPNETKARLREVAGRKLEEVRASYQEAGGTAGYWRVLEREVLETALPQYAASALEQNRLERTGYGIWRGGDPVARGAMGLGGLVLGGIIIALPFVPSLENTFAFALAAGGFAYPEIKRLVHNHRHTRLLNRLIGEAERYQKDRRIHYVSEAALEEELQALDRSGERRGSVATAGTAATPPREGRSAANEPTPGPRGKDRA